MELGFLPYHPFSLALFNTESTLQRQVIQVFMANAPKESVCYLQFIRTMLFTIYQDFFCKK